MQTANYRVAFGLCNCESTTPATPGERRRVAGRCLDRVAGSGDVLARVGMARFGADRSRKLLFGTRSDRKGSFWSPNGRPRIPRQTAKTRQDRATTRPESGRTHRVYGR